jgi:putative ABC transport system substrate-binding protein
LGYTEGQNVLFEKRFAAGHAGLISSFIADLVDRNVDIIVTTGQREGDAAKQATSSIPIVTMLHPMSSEWDLRKALPILVAT